MVRHCAGIAPLARVAVGDRRIARDELAVLLVNTDPETPYEVQRGDRIAQLVIQRVDTADFVEVAELPPSERGLGGFGSTGR